MTSSFESIPSFFLEAAAAAAAAAAVAGGGCHLILFRNIVLAVELFIRIDVAINRRFI